MSQQEVDIMQKLVSDCFNEWPPKHAVALGEHGPAIENADVITHSRVSGRWLALSLRSRSGKEYGTKVMIHEDCTEIMKEATPTLQGKTIAEAGQMPLNAS
jgi:hypothetical protein